MGEDWVKPCNVRGGTIFVGARAARAIFAAMKVKPNLTVVEGVVRAIQPDPGGYGSNVEVEVGRNISPADDADFLKPKTGERLVLFSAVAPEAEVGLRVRVQARLLAGPFGERNILEHLEAIPGSGSGH
jgi:hypothetical protein